MGFFVICDLSIFSGIEFGLFIGLVIGAVDGVGVRCSIDLRVMVVRLVRNV